ncbi:hypothetical protein [Microbulbifer sp. THAF38]|uniref:hypothetical protein n=1 Tax=Microbulbifer sp. THAF38 TaxID=2587856 RepID=UPI0012685247|nr:hypothetical protein [Microbulbifer sp. THAF38]QFT55607.1 hypothetical protein FIU95_13715 [Microbulbifer sp. THAF38]
MEKIANKRSQAAIDRLKQAWIKDPCWDIYDAEGFEAHREELEAYQKEMELKWEQQRKERINRRMESLYSLELGEEVGINGRYFIRVPGGWVMEKTKMSGVYGEINDVSVAAVFIPLSNEFLPSFFQSKE